MLPVGGRVVHVVLVVHAESRRGGIGTVAASVLEGGMWCDDGQGAFELSFEFVKLLGRDDTAVAFVACPGNAVTEIGHARSVEGLVEELGCTVGNTRGADVRSISYHELLNGVKCEFDCFC